MAMSAAYSWWISQYAYAVYCAGTYRLTADNGCVGAKVVPTQYHDAVINYAHANYVANQQIDIALYNDWITQGEYELTITGI
jgi:hypothetical protein